MALFAIKDSRKKFTDDRKERQPYIKGKVFEFARETIKNVTGDTLTKNIEKEVTEALKTPRQGFKAIREWEDRLYIILKFVVRIRST